MNNIQYIETLIISFIDVFKMFLLCIDIFIILQLLYFSVIFRSCTARIFCVIVMRLSLMLANKVLSI